MIDSIHQYPATMPSGIPWLGDVPQHWKVERLKARAENIVDLTAAPKGSGLYVALEHVESWTGAIRKADSDVTFESRVKRFRATDVLFGKLRPYLAKVAQPAEAGVCVGEFLVLRPRANAVNVRFLAYLLRSKPIIDAIGSSTFGAKMPRADWAFLGTMRLPFPSSSEQGAIVRFLDHAEWRIGRGIRVKKKLILLLAELKETVIHTAVTRGLDPDVGLKPSGIEWVGEIPKHWAVVPNRAVLRLRKQVVGNAFSDFALLSLTKRGVILRDLDNPEGKFPTSFETYQAVAPGDLIFCLFDIDETPRAIGLSSLLGMVTGAYTCFRCVEPDATDYVYLFYLAMDGGKCLKPLYTGLRKVITKSAFLSARMPLPTRAERLAIVGHIRHEVGEIDRLIADLDREIGLLHEFRGRLIADVVTGKLDVREAAAGLPDHRDQPEPLDEVESEEEREDVELEAILEQVEA